MKECYFTLENIADRGRELLHSIETLRRRRQLRVDLARTALVVADMQRFFLEEDSHAFIPSAMAIIAGLQKLIASYRAYNRPIVWTRHINTPENAGMMKMWWRDLLSRDNPLSQLSPAMPVGDDIVLEKSQYDAFYGTDLEDLLRSKGISQIAICGVMTHLCCETIARSAFVRGFEVLFLIDATATYNEAFHRGSLCNLAHGFAYPLLVDELIAALFP